MPVMLEQAGEGRKRKVTGICQPRRIRRAPVSVRNYLKKIRGGADKERQTPDVNFYLLFSRTPENMHTYTHIK